MSKSHNRRTFGSMPSPAQTMLALILGVLIGMCVVNGIRANRLQRLWNDEAAPKFVAMAEKLDASRMFNNLPKINVLPTVDERMNILVMGVDSNGRNTDRFSSTRSDTMMLVSVDPAEKRVGVISIPRDSRVPIAGNHGTDKINSAHAYGGPELAMQTVRDNFGAQIDHYIVVDAQGLKKLVEVLGPVQILVEKKMHYRDRAGGLYVSLEPGLQQLDASQTEQYVRFRHDAKGDIGRIERQQWFIRQVGEKLKDPSVILKLPDLFEIANDYVRTDLSIDDMMKLANFAKDVKPGDIQTAMVPGMSATIHGGSYWIPDMKACPIVFNRLAGTPLSSFQVNEAYAADDSSQGLYVAPANEPISVVIKYGKGSEDAAKQLEAALIAKGYKVKYRTRVDNADSQHEVIVQNSLRADDSSTRKIREALPLLAEWPVGVNLDNRNLSDFTLVVSPRVIDSINSLPIAAEQ